MREDLPCRRDQRIPAPSESEEVVTAGAGAGARGHPGGQGPGLDPDVAHRVGLAGVVLPLDRTSRAGLDHAGEEHGGARRLSRAHCSRAHAARGAQEDKAGSGQQQVAS